MPTLDLSTIEMIGRGAHPDPFSVFGPHKAGNKTVYRLFMPEAEAVRWISGSKTQEMERLSTEGLFEGQAPAAKDGKYHFELTFRDGTTKMYEDPYRFGIQISDYDLHLWGEGRHFRAWNFMGAHPKTVDGVAGTHFVVTAPGASRVSVVGPFNRWDGRCHPMRKHADQGLWEIFIPGLQPGQLYKFEISSPYTGQSFVKADPFAFSAELRPLTASVITKSDFSWSDISWIENRAEKQKLDQPVSIYEVHLGSWRRNENDPPYLSYRELADQLIPYAKDLGFTHLELLPVAEHPYDPSWGYQITGYYAPTSRFGSPDDFRYFVDRCHNEGIGVIVDWVPAHFAKDAHGLRMFDGTHLFEHADPRQGEHRDWGTMIFNFGRNEVLNFLVSNAIYWCEEFHIDGLRVDAVASMLYLDYSRNDGEWVPNKYGGRENLEAIHFLKTVNEVLHAEFPGVLTMAEESTSWPMVSKPTYVGGLGFDYKWNMGWMNDTLQYMGKDAVYRKYHHDKLTFSLMYAFSEQFLLPFSHDEVVHLKKSLLSKMPGDIWQKFANLRLLYAYMFSHPGKKLLFMGGEFGQWAEWNCEAGLEWSLLDYDTHRSLQEAVRAMNHIYQSEKALHEVDADWSGFTWIDHADADQSALSFIRFAREKEDHVVCVSNFTPVVRHNYRIGVPKIGEYEIILNTDDRRFGGSGVTSYSYMAYEGASHDQPAHIVMTLPPLAAVWLRPRRNDNG